MTTARANHIAVLLPNGKVLIAGGVTGGFPPQPLTSAELYDPSTRSFTSTGSMTVPRGSPGAVLLANGKVLILGGSQDLSAEIYDPSTGTFSATGNMISAGAGSSQSVFDFRHPTLLQDGRVLVQGVNAQIYDPATGTFALTVAYSEANPLWSTSTSLQDGKVLLTGCVGPSSCGGGATELFDPRTVTFNFTGAFDKWDDVNTATLLMNGKVLFVGNAENDGFPADAELYDPAAGTFTSIGPTTAPHEFAAAVRIADGRVLITGGQLPGGSGAASTDLYDPATGKFTSAGNMTVGRHEHTATLLPDGTVLITGGHSSWPASTSSAEIYTPTGPWDYLRAPLSGRI
jgi:hypothetical protein